MLSRALKCLAIVVGLMAFAVLAGAVPQPGSQKVLEHPGPPNLANITGVFDTEALVFNKAGTKGYIIHVARDDNAFVTELTVPNIKGGTCELGVLKGPRGSHAVAYQDEANARLWVGNFPEGNVSVVDLSQPLEKKCAIVATIPVNDQAEDVVYDAQRNRAYVSGSLTNSVFVLNLSGITATVDLSAQCQGPSAMALDANYLYVGCKYTNNLVRINLGSLQVDGVAKDAGELPVDVALWGGNLYVAASVSDTAVVIDSAKMEQMASVAIVGKVPGPNPRYVAVSPEGKFVYTSNAADQSVSVICRATNELLETFRAIDENRITTPGVLKTLDYKGVHLLYVPDKGGLLQVFVMDVIYIKYEQKCP